jgi:hypothetical protein
MLLREHNGVCPHDSRHPSGARYTTDPGVQKPARTPESHPEVQDFITARFVVSAANLTPYQKTIQEALYPDVVRGEDLNLARGRKAITEYQQATHDPIGTLDVMTRFVECGTLFAVEYHDGDEELYED